MLTFARQMCSAIARIHECGWINLDIKAENTSVSRTSAGHDLVYILDMGVARRCQGQEVLEDSSQQGTIQYMAPEWVYSGRLSQKSDTWALGVCALFTLTGQHPFGDTPEEVVAQVVCEPELPPVSFPTQTLLLGLLCLEEEDRLTAAEAKKLLGADEAAPEVAESSITHVSEVASPESPTGDSEETEEASSIFDAGEEQKRVYECAEAIRDSLQKVVKSGQPHVLEVLLQVQAALAALESGWSRSTCEESSSEAGEVKFEEDFPVAELEQVCIQPLAARQRCEQECEVVAKPGLIAEYFLKKYEGMSIPKGVAPDVIRVEQQLDYDEARLPSQGLPDRYTKGFSARFTGYLNLCSMEGMNAKYTFYLESGKKAKLYLNDNLVVEEDRPGQIELQKGLHLLRVEYFCQDSALHGLKLKYKGPETMPRVEEPQELLPQTGIVMVPPTAMCYYSLLHSEQSKGSRGPKDEMAVGYVLWSEDCRTITQLPCGSKVHYWDPPSEPVMVLTVSDSDSTSKTESRHIGANVHAEPKKSSEAVRPKEAKRMCGRRMQVAAHRDVVARNLVLAPVRRERPKEVPLAFRQPPRKANPCLARGLGVRPPWRP